MERLEERILVDPQMSTGEVIQTQRLGRMRTPGEVRPRIIWV